MVEEAYKQSAVGQESAISTPIVEIHGSNKKVICSTDIIYVHVIS